MKSKKMTIIFVMIIVMFVSCANGSSNEIVPFEKNKIWGYKINGIGKYIKYDETYPFINKIGKVKKQNRYNIINMEGNLLLKQWYKWIHNSGDYCILFNNMYSIYDSPA